MKKNIMLIALGFILAIGCVVIADNLNANEIDYKNNKKVSEALDDLYGKVDLLSNYTEIYTTGDYGKRNHSYTIDKSYPMVIVVVDAIGSASGSDATSTSITLTSSSQELISLVNNQKTPYNNWMYYSSLSVAYVANPDIGSVINCSLNYYGYVHIYAIDPEQSQNNQE